MNILRATLSKKEIAGKSIDFESKATLAIKQAIDIISDATRADVGLYPIFNNTYAKGRVRRDSPPTTIW